MGGFAYFLEVVLDKALIGSLAVMGMEPLPGEIYMRQVQPKPARVNTSSKNKKRVSKAVRKKKRKAQCVARRVNRKK